MYNFSPQRSIAALVSNPNVNITYNVNTQENENAVRIYSVKENTDIVWVKFSASPDIAVIPINQMGNVCFPVIPGAIEIFAISPILRYVNMISSVGGQNIYLTFGNGS